MIKWRIWTFCVLLQTQKVPINVFSSTSRKTESKLDTFWFVPKPYLRTNYFQSITGEEIDMKYHFKFKKLPLPVDDREVASKSYVDNRLNDPSIVKNFAHIVFKDESLDKVRLLKLDNFASLSEHATTKKYVDQSFDEPTLVGSH